VLSLFTIELQRLHHRPIVEGKQNRFIVTEVFMGMPMPQRDDEGVALAPFQIRVAELRATMAFDDMIQRRAGMERNKVPWSLMARRSAWSMSIVSLTLSSPSSSGSHFHKWGASDVCEGTRVRQKPES
jgi:hypothetical protein